MAKHARATTVQIRVEPAGGRVRVEVADDGVGGASAGSGSGSGG